jgi:hypothetical protein
VSHLPAFVEIGQAAEYPFGLVSIGGSNLVHIWLKDFDPACGASSNGRPVNDVCTNLTRRPVCRSCRLIVEQASAGERT